jgi:16S rRNA (guanine527-N7)-methyltransferase
MKDEIFLHFFILKQQNFIEAVKRNQSAFGLDLSEEIVLRLAGYYELIEKWNARLHLVAPATAEEFAVRHALESLILLDYLSPEARLTDIGAGAGLPSLPCLLASADLRGALVESNTKKAVFLRETVAHFGLQTRVSIVNSRFENVVAPIEGFVTSRALDKFLEKLPEIVGWSQAAEKLLFFGGEKMRDKLAALRLNFASRLIPKSEQRFLFVAEPPRR